MKSCKCSSGGGGSCSPGQFAICRAEGGECYVSCIDITAAIRRVIINQGPTAPQVLSWIVSLVGSAADQRRLQIDSSFRRNLERGKYVTEHGRVIAEFDLAAQIQGSGGSPPDVAGSPATGSE
jgi:hypothetical protein